MVEGYKGRISYQQFDAGSQGGKPVREEEQVPAQSGASERAGEKPTRKTYAETLLEISKGTQLGRRRPPTSMASMGPNPLQASLPDGIPVVLEPREQLENQLREREHAFDALIGSGTEVEYFTRYAFDLQIYQLREKIRILKEQEKRSSQ